MFKLRLVRKRKGGKGKRHLLSAYAAATRGYGTFPAACGDRITVPMWQTGESSAPIGQPYDPDNKPDDLCKRCERLVVL